MVKSFTKIKAKNYEGTTETKVSLEEYFEINPNVDGVFEYFDG